MTDSLISRAEDRDFQRLFIEDLNWSRPDLAPVSIDVDGERVAATNVSSQRGLRVWTVDRSPDSSLEAALDRALAQTSTDRIVIFHDEQEQVWRWPVRRSNSSSTTTRLSRHRHVVGQVDLSFAQKLEYIRLPNDEVLDSNAVLSRVRQAFDIEAHNETKHASKLMARLYASMDMAYPSEKPREERDHEISVALARLLFLLFGDDTEMWAPDLFANFLRDRTASDGSDLGEALSALFDYLDTTERNRTNEQKERFEGFRYVNGRIFSEPIQFPTLNRDFRAALLEACERDWSTISPAIFGSMFQSVRDAKTRRQLGEHYTSEQNILKTLNPLFLDELWAEFAHVRTLGRYEADRLRKLRKRLGKIRFMDPACGCGNFIIVAYRELRDLELAILERLQEITGEERNLLANLDLQVSLNHFYGIEVDEWPARIAETAMFMVDRQCDLKLTASLGEAPDRLPIKEQATVVVGNALRVDWADVCPPSSGQVIVAGNPPFLGPHTRTKDQLADLQDVWGSKDLGRLDYVTGWHRKAVDYLEEAPASRFAFVSTSSIAQGDQATRLAPYLRRRGWRLRFAHQTFPWTSEATGKAAVHCVITGHDREQSPRPVLFQYPDFSGQPQQVQAANINGYLVDGPDIEVDPRPMPLAPDLEKVVLGSMAKDDGNLILGPTDHERYMADDVASLYVRPYLGSKELLQGQPRWCLWLDGAPEEHLQDNSLIRERVEAVRHFRLAAKAPSTRDFASISHLFTQRAAQDSVFVCIPGTSSAARLYLPCRRVDANVIASHANYQVRDDDGLQFAVLSSSMLLTWQKTIGGRLKSDIRFAVRTVWNNFPLPRLSSRQRADLIEAGQAVIAARELEANKTLSEHYAPSQMSRALLDAHDSLDRVMDGVFGLTGQVSEGERQQALFDAYIARTS